MKYYKDNNSNIIIVDIITVPNRFVIKPLGRNTNWTTMTMELDKFETMIGKYDYIPIDESDAILELI